MIKPLLCALGLLTLLSLLASHLVTLRQPVTSHIFTENAPTMRMRTRRAAASPPTTMREIDKIVIWIQKAPPQLPGPKTRLERLRTIQETWGAFPDESTRLLLVFDEEDEGLQEAATLWDIEEPYQEEHRAAHKRYASGGRILLVPAEHAVDATARFQYVLRQISWLHDPDFTVVAEEHTFLILENLRCFLRAFEPAMPHYLGHRFPADPPERPTGLNTAAPGFVLSRKAMQLLSKIWTEANHEREEDGAAALEGATATRSRGFASASDTRTAPQQAAAAAQCRAVTARERDSPSAAVAGCLHAIGVEAADTRDASGAQRFHVYGPVRETRGEVDDWYRRFHAPEGELPVGTSCCAADTVSFHYMGPDEARTLHDMLHEGRERWSMPDKSPRELAAMYPTRDEVGGYSRAPGRDDGAVWHLLLHKMRLCGARRRF